MVGRITEHFMGIPYEGKDGKTPFRLAYGSEVVIPAKVGLTSYRVGNHDESGNDKALHLQLDLVDEVRAMAKQRLTR